MSIKQIAVCTDFSDHSEKAFVTACEIAEQQSAKLIVLHVMPPIVNPVYTEFDSVAMSGPDKSIVLELEERMEQEYGSRIKEGVDYELIVLDGHVSTSIITFLEENKIDLAVLGAFGLSGMGLVIFGSVAKRVAHKAPCSVMIVRERE
jgi:universal stress protein A